MTKKIPIDLIGGIELVDTELKGVSSVVVKSSHAKSALTWDRYVRLSAAAAAIERISGGGRILDVGGFDGALALFLPGREIDLIDPATTGATILSTPITTGAYEIVVAIDVLEHIEPLRREQALEEMARMAERHVVLNYPHRGTKSAQELVFHLTGNSLIKEHAEWELPDTNRVLETMVSFGFSGEVHPHSSLAVWIGQYLTTILAPGAASAINGFLIENHSDEPHKVPLYDLVVMERH